MRLPKLGVSRDVAVWKPLVLHGVGVTRRKSELIDVVGRAEHAVAEHRPTEPQRNGRRGVGNCQVIERHNVHTAFLGADAGTGEQIDLTPLVRLKLVGVLVQVKPRRRHLVAESVLPLDGVLLGLCRDLHRSRKNSATPSAALRCSCGFGMKPGDVLRHRADAVGRNPVVRKRVARESSALPGAS